MTLVGKALIFVIRNGIHEHIVSLLSWFYLFNFTFLDNYMYIMYIDFHIKRCKQHMLPPEIVCVSTLTK